MADVPGSTVNYFMRSVIAIVIAATQHDLFNPLGQIALHWRVSQL
jgi:hypothetical protein